MCIINLVNKDQKKNLYLESRYIQSVVKKRKKLKYRFLIIYKHDIIKIYLIYKVRYVTVRASGSEWLTIAKKGDVLIHILQQNRSYKNTRR